MILFNAGPNRGPVRKFCLPYPFGRASRRRFDQWTRVDTAACTGVCRQDENRSNTGTWTSEWDTGSVTPWCLPTAGHEKGRSGQV